MPKVALASTRSSLSLWFKKPRTMRGIEENLAATFVSFVDEPDVKLFLECSLRARSHIGRSVRWNLYL